MFKLVALSVAALLWGAWAVLKLREVEGEPLRKVLEGFSRLGWFNKVAILFVVAQLTMFGGAKHGGTNDVDDVGGTNAPPLTMGVRFGGSSSRISPEDYDNGYVLYRVETNETFDFSAPEGAAVATNWMLRGAATDYLRISLGDGLFPFRDAERTNLIAFADGTIRFAADAELPPLAGSVSLVPQANWGLLDETNRPSVFWWDRANVETWRFTWQNALADRCATNPVSYQVELQRNGDFVRRIGGTTFRYAALVREDRTNPDRDGDGLTTEEEIFDYGTDPGLYDTDGDGMSDGEEVCLQTNPFARDTDGDLFADATDPNPTTIDSWDDADRDGFPDAWTSGWFGEETFDPDADPGNDGIDNRTAFLMGVNPLASGTNGFVEASVAKPVNLNAWVISPSAFSFDRPEGCSNLIIRTFSVERVSPWQQFFVSSRPDGADGWQSSDVVIEWSSDESSGILPNASVDSFRIPLETDDRSRTMTFRVMAAGTRPSLSRPLYLLRWTPHLDFRPSYNVCVFNQERQRIAVRPDPETGAYDLPVSLDCGRHPHRGGIDAAVASDLAWPPIEGLEMSAGGFTVSSPSAFDLPPEGLEPSKRLIFYELTVGSSARVPSGPRASQYDSPYPLNSKSLRRSYQENHQETTADEVTVTILPDIPELGYVDLSPRLMRGLLGATGSVRAPGDVGPEVGGEPCTNDTHHIDQTADGMDSEPDEDDSKSDSCSCDNDGTSFGSFRIRISFGEPGREEISGYLWAQVFSPTLVRASTFNILGKSGVSAVTNDTGDVEISCSDANGRHISVSNVVNGVDVYVRLTSGELDSIWQVRNPEGDPSTIRARRFTHLMNATVDETYAIRHDDEGRVLWVQTDNITGVRREKIEVSDPDEPAFVAEEIERTFLDDRKIREEMRIYERIGAGRSAVRRLSAADGWDERGYYSERKTYYCDAAHVYRHGKLRSCRSGRKAWTYYNYDSQGRETVRIEQMDGSPFPNLGEVALGAALPARTSAKITVSAYACAAADSDDRNDIALPRLVETYVRTNGGSPILISRTERTCTREYDSRGIPVRRIVTTEGFGAATRTSTRLEYPEDSAVPAVLRGMEVYSEESDGSVIETEYSVSNAFIVATARTSFNGNYRKTYTVTVYDAAFRLPVREETRLTENDAVIEWTANAYDDRQRLRSSVYSDGTSETNAYSCCRLLWRRDREGRRVLRSARTGTDSLYYAEEDVWRAGISEDGRFRIVQHFFDGLGRETNTVTYAGSNEGEAVDPFVPASGQHPVVRTTEYLDEGRCRGSSTTDERGAFIDQWEYSSESSVESHFQTTADGKTSGETRTTYRGGRTETYKQWDGKWTRQTASTGYGADGSRVDMIVTESSDCGTVTNSVMVYDPLGRIVSQVTPLGTTHLAYDGTTTRMMSETFTAGDVTSVRTYLYDESGEEIGSVQDGVANRSEIGYEEESNVWWKVTRESAVAVDGPGASATTNSFTVTREQLTGLGVGLRSRVITDRMNGEKNSATVTCDPATGCTTETQTSSLASPVTVRSFCGVELSRTAETEEVTSSVDAWGRCVGRVRYPLHAAEPIPFECYLYNDVGDMVGKGVFTNETDVVSEYYEYDQLGNRIVTELANGEEVFSAYDAQGNLVSEDGATYPVRYDYDTANRRVSMRTTRDGETWDETRWTYDPATGLCTSKRRADGTTVNYTYTPDGLLETTTRSNGHWVRNVYNAARQIVGVETDDGDDVTFVRDPFGRETSVSNAAATYAYALDVCGVATNETAAVGGATFAIRRVVDSDGRRIALDVEDAAESVAYRADGKIGVVSNADAVVTYVYTEDGKNAGSTLVVSGGATFVREVIRDGFRRELVTRVENGIGADFTYGFDALGRPVSRNGDSFAYDARGEVSGAWTAGNVELYAYDEIGNATSAAFNLSTNLYSANAVNEYVGIESDGVEIATAYDEEGNLTQYGEWSYTYDAQNRLATVSSNGLFVASNFYDHMGRRVRMVTPDAVTTFIYDGWNLALELSERGGETERTEYYWGKDISESLQGAGGIGGLLYLKRNGTIFVPIYDAYGNVMEYRAADGSLVASYTYDAFGRTIVQTGSLADVFRHRHATKFYESETGFYYYGHRHYVPSLARWLTTDPIEEDGGLNLYAFCANNALSRYDALGQAYRTCVNDCMSEWARDWSEFLLAMYKFMPIPKFPSEWGRGFGKVSYFTTLASRKVSAVWRRLIMLGFDEELARKAAQGVRGEYGLITQRLFLQIIAFEVGYNIGAFYYCSISCCGEDGVTYPPILYLR